MTKNEKGKENTSMIEKNRIKKQNNGIFCYNKPVKNNN